MRAEARKISQMLKDMPAGKKPLRLQGNSLGQGWENGAPDFIRDFGRGGGGSGGGGWGFFPYFLVPDCSH